MSRPIFDNKAFIEFLESKGDEPYNYWDVNNCAVMQYLKSRGVINPVNFFATSSSMQLFDWNANVAFPSPHTFSAAAQRARELLNV